MIEIIMGNIIVILKKETTTLFSQGERCPTVCFVCDIDKIDWLDEFRWEIC
jgi:hypothetical protein